MLTGNQSPSNSRSMHRADRFAFKRTFAFWTVLVLAALLPNFAFARSWRIADFKDTISVGQDGSTLVVERINLVFIGEWNGIHRIIPVEYPGPGTTNYTLFLEVKSVTDENGSKLKYESKTSRGYRDLKIYIPAPSTRPKRCKLSTRFGMPYVISRLMMSSIGMSLGMIGLYPSITPKPSSPCRRPLRDRCELRRTPGSTAQPKARRLPQ